MVLLQSNKVKLLLFHNVFIALPLFLVEERIGVTNDLSQSLQKKDQDIVNAMKLLRVCKDMFQAMRDDGYESLLAEVSTFC